MKNEVTARAAAMGYGVQEARRVKDKALTDPGRDIGVNHRRHRLIHTC